MNIGYYFIHWFVLCNSFFSLFFSGDCYRGLQNTLTSCKIGRHSAFNAFKSSYSTMAWLLKILTVDNGECSLFRKMHFLLIAAACSYLAGVGDWYKLGKGPGEALLIPKKSFSLFIQ